MRVRFCAICGFVSCMRSSASCRRTCMMGLRSIAVTLQPKDASSHASCPYPAVVSSTLMGRSLPDFSPMDLSRGCL